MARVPAVRPPLARPGTLPGPARMLAAGPFAAGPPAAGPGAAPAPVPARRRATWNCAHCTLENQPEDLACQVCENPRDVGAAGPPPAAAPAPIPAAAAAAAARPVANDNRSPVRADVESDHSDREGVEDQDARIATACTVLAEVARYARDVNEAAFFGGVLQDVEAFCRTREDGFQVARAAPRSPPALAGGHAMVPSSPAETAPGSPRFDGVADPDDFLEDTVPYEVPGSPRTPQGGPIDDADADLYDGAAAPVEDREIHEVEAPLDEQAIAEEARAQLSCMGFPASVVAESMRRCTNINDALDWMCGQA